MKRVSLLHLVFLLMMPSVAAQAGDWTSIFIVRHAEKEAGDDPGLTAQGLERARRLEELLSNARIDALFSSEYRRTRDTLQALGCEASVSAQDRGPERPRI